MERKYPLTHPVAKTKILSCLQEVRALADGGMPAPRTVELFVTTACNHACTGCHTRALRGPVPAHLDIARARGLITEWAALGVRGLEISGIGEPLLYPHIEDLLDTAAAHGLSAGLLTNGSMLHTVDNRQLLRATRFIRIALDAATPETYRTVHGADDFTRVCGNAEKLIATRRKTRAKTTIGLKALISQRNLGEIPGIAASAHALGADYVQFKALRNHKAALTKKQIPEAGARIQKSKEKYGGEINFRVLGGVERERLAQPCCLSPLHPVLDPAAALYVCPYYTHHPATHRIGSLKTKHFADLWGAPAHRRGIKNIDPAICNKFDCPLIPFNNFAKAAILDDAMHLDFI